MSVIIQGPVSGLSDADQAYIDLAQTTVPDASKLVNSDNLGTAAAADTTDFDVAGAAAAVAGDLTTHEGLTGTAVHGLGTMATEPATSYHVTSAFSATPTAAEPLKADGSGGIRFAAKLSVGTSPTADDVLFNARRSLTGVVNSHGYRDESAHTPGAGSTGYAAFDAEYSMAGGVSYDHFAGFQNRPAFSGSGTITKHRGFWSMPTHTGTGTLTSLQHFYAANAAPSGGGAITTQYGLYVESLTGGVSNYAVFTAGSTPSYFGGLLQAGSNFRVDGLASFGNVAASTAYQVYTSCTLDATKIAANAVLATAPINLSTGNAYGAFYSLSAANNTLAAIGTNYLYGFTARAAIQATAANSAARYAYAMHSQFLATANAGYTASAIGAYGLLVDAPGMTGAGTLSFGLIAGIVINNQGTGKAPTSYGLKIENQSGSATGYAIYTDTGTVRLMGADSDKIGFHGVTPVARQLLATGAGATVDDVITALQTVGLLRQS